jgi:hypothetical protein
MNIVFFPKYTEKGASSRYRIYQYLNILENKGISIEVYPLLDDYYMECLYNKKKYPKFRLLKRYFKRLFVVLNLKKDTILYLQHEFFPFFPPIFEWYLSKIRKVSYVVDYDDAIFHNYDLSRKALIRYLYSNKIPSVISMSSAVVAGSPYLSSFAKKYSTNVIEIPTSINIDRYKKTYNSIDSDAALIIGWIGSKSTSKSLKFIVESIKRISSKYNVKLFLLGFDKSLVYIFEGIDYKLIKWSSETEVNDIFSFDVGIMPLEDTPFNNGKCGFKLIQYMACSLPTISSPLEANQKINRNGKNLHASTNDEWFNSFERIIQNKEYFFSVGIENRLDVENHYSIQSNVLNYIDLFNKIKHGK